jgi:putative transposase
MNCVRAGIVKRPEEYGFSSYQAKVGLKKIEWLDFDPIYLDLGETERERQKKYQDWAQESIPKGEWEMIRESIQKNWAYGNNRFKEKIENMLGRRFELKRAGRRSKGI